MPKSKGNGLKIGLMLLSLLTGGLALLQDHLQQKQDEERTREIFEEMYNEHTQIQEATFTEIEETT